MIANEVREEIIRLRSENERCSSTDIIRGLGRLGLKAPNPTTITSLLRKAGMPITHTRNRYDGEYKSHALQLLRSGLSSRSSKTALNDKYGYSPSVSCLDKWRQDDSRPKIKRMPGTSIWEHIQKLKRGQWKRGDKDSGRPLSDIIPDVWDAMEDAGLHHQEIIDGLMHHFYGGQIKTSDTFWKNYKRSKREKKMKKAA